MDLAVQAARAWVGATCPNPPVGAAILDAAGHVLTIQAHQRAGHPHAEALCLVDLGSRGLLEKAHTLVVTLEPCNHQGRTPPCTQAILKVPSIRRVVFAEKDPNPKVVGGGAEFLRSQGIDVVHAPREAAHALLAPFAHWVTTGKPWVVVKRALDRQGSMVPPAGSKTFTSEDSLKLAHVLRRESDAIITGSGTILADDPEFTVRRVPDHPGKRRFLVLLDRRRRVSPEWISRAGARGLDVLRFESPEEALSELGGRGCLQALVEAGPGVSGAFLDGCLWNRHVVIQQGNPGKPDQITECLQESSRT
jgi:diaminohydroxyphosphoribosylaminopyrimidine deaminase/5-amino-6-(5-phosphoribosylamino)uracil reductase